MIRRNPTPLENDLDNDEENEAFSLLHWIRNSAVGAGFRQDTPVVTEW